MRELMCLYPGAVPAEFVDYVNGLAEKIAPQDGVLGESTEKGRVDLQYRKSEIRWLPIEIQQHFTIVDSLWYYARQANRNLFGFDVDYIQDIQHTTYKADVNGNGKYDWHHDTFWAGPNAYDRKISITIQLSDPSEYEGGHFEIDPQYQQPDPELLRQKGTVLVFPSFLRHRVTPVTKGVRKSLVSWVEGPKFR